jgi:hypothetical protein
VHIEGLYDRECYPFTVSENREGLGQFANNVVQILSEVPAGQKLVEVAQRHNVPICFEPMDGAFGYYSLDDKKMVVNPFYSYSGAITTISHELRHAQQDLDFKMLDIFNLSLSMRTSAAMNKIVEADAEAYQNLVTYQLAELGYSFEYIFSHKEDRKLYIPLAQAFYDELPRNRAASDNDIARAMRAAFTAWLDHEQLNKIYEGRTAQFYASNTIGQPEMCFDDEMLSIDMGSLEKAIASITRMPNGQSYVMQSGGAHAFSAYFNQYADPEIHEVEQAIYHHVNMNRCSGEPATSNAVMSRTR